MARRWAHTSRRRESDREPERRHRLDPVPPPDVHRIALPGGDDASGGGRHRLDPNDHLSHQGDDGAADLGGRRAIRDLGGLRSGIRVVGRPVTDLDRRPPRTSHSGAGAGNRTPDLFITSEMLCRLSYSGGRPSVPSLCVSAHARRRPTCLDAPIRDGVAGSGHRAGHDCRLLKGGCGLATGRISMSIAACACSSADDRATR